MKPNRLILPILVVLFGILLLANAILPWNMPVWRLLFEQIVI